MDTFRSDLSGNEFPIHEKVSAKLLRHSLLTFIQKKHPDFQTENYLSVTELNHIREEYVTSFLKKESGQLSKLEKTVLSSLTDKSILTDALEDESDKQRNTGQRIADKVASFGGSWTFIISFGVFLALWITSNVILLANKGFDPYPFILLNLILSCIAAMQAPVIMMSQNRQEEKDRERAKKDYMINLKSELEIRTLHEKIDHLMLHQQKEIIEIQQVQVDILNDIIARVENLK